MNATSLSPRHSRPRQSRANGNPAPSVSHADPDGHWIAEFAGRPQGAGHEHAGPAAHPAWPGRRHARTDGAPLPDGLSPREAGAAPVSSSPFAIREATEADAHAVFDLICFRAELDGCLPSVQSTPRKLALAMRGTSPYFRALLAEAEGLAIGFAAFHQTFSTSLAQPGIWLDDLFVREGHRALGVGTALVRQLARLATRNGCARIDWTVAGGNAGGRKFCGRIGSQVSEDTRHCRLDAAGIARLTAGGG